MFYHTLSYLNIWHNDKIFCRIIKFLLKCLPSSDQVFRNVNSTLKDGLGAWRQHLKNKRSLFMVLTDKCCASCFFNFLFHFFVFGKWSTSTIGTSEFKKCIGFFYTLFSHKLTYLLPTKTYSLFYPFYVDSTKLVPLFETKCHLKMIFYLKEFSFLNCVIVLWKILISYYYTLHINSSSI